jgi:SAM-dependent methyltransferase
VISLDVLQHLPRPHGDQAALAEFARVLSPGGALLLRTNSRCGRRQADAADYQRYRIDALRSLLERAGFSCVVSSYVNCLPAFASTVASRLRGRHAPSADPGLPASSRRLTAADRLGYGWLALEAAYLHFGSLSLPYGHSIVALARNAARGSQAGPSSPTVGRL